MKLNASLALWRRRVTYRETKLAKVRRQAHATGTVTRTEAAHIHKWEALLKQARELVARREQQIKDARPLRTRALAEATKLVGVMEQGGNNTGAAVMEIIRANGGTGPEPWCGDFVAWCYRRAGSKSVVRAWAAVRFLGFLAGMKTVTSPQPGDIVCFTFDHTGLFKRWIDRNAGVFETIEGNTGATGAVSDSKTGGDGVYIKRRQLAHVARWVHVTR